MTTRRSAITAADLPPPSSLSAGAPIDLLAGDLPPAQPVPQAPTRLRQIGTSTVVASAVSPRARVQLTWDPLPGVPDVRYEVRWATNAIATENVGSGASNELSARIDTLVTGTNYWFWVRALAGALSSPWSVALGPVLTASDTAPPAPPTTGTAIFATDGTLEIRATPPDSPNYKRIDVEIWDGANTTLLDESEFGGGLWTWSPQRNRLQTAAVGGSGATTAITARLYAVSWGNVRSTGITATATATAPASPTGLTHSWVSDTGTAAAELIVSWAPVAGLSYWLSIDSLEREVFGGSYRYSYEQNRQEHSGTADKVLTLSLLAENGLGQRSTAATATATNAAPPATTLTAFAAFSTLNLSVAASTARDLQDYRYRIYKSAVLVKTFYDTSTLIAYAVENGDGSYTADVAARDVFGQVGTASSQTTAAAITDMTAFVVTLRSGLIYSDSVGTTADALAGLKDGNLGSDVVLYAAGVTWKTTTADWQEEITTQTTEISLGATASVYIGYSLDGTTWTYYHGTTPAGGRWQPAATTAVEATAQAGAQNLTAGTWRIDIPAPRRARFIRIGHRSTVTPYALREFFPATLLRGTYVQAESITSVLIAAGAVVADKIAAGALDAYTITGGTIVGGTITGGVVSGATIQTAASGQRVVIDTAGLKTYNSAGVVQIEATTTTDGALKAGAGAISLDATGLYMSGGVTTRAEIRWENTLDTDGIVGMHIGTSPAVRFSVRTRGSGGALEVGTTSGNVAFDVAYNRNRYSGVGMLINGSDLPPIYIGGDVRIDSGLDVLYGLNVGKAAGVPLGAIYASAASGGNYVTALGGLVPSGKSGVSLYYDEANDRARLDARLTGTAEKPLLIYASALGWGVTPVARPTVTGSRGGNAALASLCTALASLGLITNSTS